MQISKKCEEEGTVIIDPYKKMPLLCLIFRVRAIPVFSNNFHIKVWFNKPYYCIVMYTKERKIETPPYQGKLGAILSLRWCLFVEKCCNSFRRLLFYYALLLVAWPSKLFINYQMEFKLHKMEGPLKRNATIWYNSQF